MNKQLLTDLFSSLGHKVLFNGNKLVDSTGKLVFKDKFGNYFINTNKGRLYFSSNGKFSSKHKEKGLLDKVGEKLDKFAYKMGLVNPQGTNAFHHDPISNSVSNLSLIANTGTLKLSDGSYRRYSDEERNTARKQLGILGAGQIATPITAHGAVNAVPWMQEWLPHLTFEAGAEAIGAGKVGLGVAKAADLAMMAVPTGLAANDMIQNGVNLKNSSELALGLLPVGIKGIQWLGSKINPLEWTQFLNPGSRIVYRGGTSQGNSAVNFGKHYAESPEVAEQFGDVTAHVIKRPKAEVIDLMDNNYDMVSRTWTPDVTRTLTAVNDVLKLNILKEAGNKFTITGTPEDLNFNFTSTRPYNLRAKLFPRLSSIGNRQLDRVGRVALLVEKDADGMIVSEDLASDLNTRVANILSREGYDVLSYKNAVEGLENGKALTSYILTTPKAEIPIEEFPSVPDINTEPMLAVNTRHQSKTVTPHQSRLSEQERLGIPKGERNNKQKELVDKINAYLINKGLTPLEKYTTEQLEAFEDFFAQMKYQNADIYVTPENYFWIKSRKPNITKSNVNLFNSRANRRNLLVYLQSEELEDGDKILTVVMNRKDERFIPARVEHFNGGNKGFSELSYGLNLRTSEGNYILTSPRANASEFDIPRDQLLLYSDRAPKYLTKPFFQEVAHAQTPGSYATGDSNGIPLGFKLFSNRDNPEAFYLLLTEPYVATTDLRGRGLATGSYAKILRDGLRPKYKLRYSHGDLGFTKWNDLSLDKEVYEAIQKANKTHNELDINNALTIFNDWAKGINPNAHEAYVDESGLIRIPHPWSFKYELKNGGKLI